MPVLGVSKNCPVAPLSIRERAQKPTEIQESDSESRCKILINFWSSAKWQSGRSHRNRIF